MFQQRQSSLSYQSNKSWEMAIKNKSDGFGACRDMTAVFGRLRDRPSAANAALVSPSLVFVSCDDEMGGDGVDVPRPWNMMRRLASWPFGDDE